MAPMRYSVAPQRPDTCAAPTPSPKACSHSRTSMMPANHPLRVIRTMVNKALMGDLFAQMYGDDIKAGAPASLPEKLLRAMLLQVLYSVRSGAS